MQLDRRIRWRAPAIAGAAALASWAFSRLLSDRPALAEAYAAGPGPALTRPLSRLTGLAPFSIGEILLAAYAVVIVVLSVRALRALVGRRRSWRNAIAGSVQHVIRDGSIAITLFYLLWGLNYARPALEQRLGWPQWNGADTPELVRLAEQAVATANQAYIDLQGSPDAGTPTLMAAPWKEVETAIDEGWSRSTTHLRLPRATGRRYGRVKQPVTSPLIARFGIVGMFFPFTAEAHALRGMPAVRFVAAAAHEKAHQRGIANEAEASFLGYVAASLAPDPLARYGAAVFAENQIVAALAAADPDAYQRITGLRLPGVTRDLLDVAAYFNKYRGVSVAVGRAVNDSYLRANRVPGGVQSYARSVRLLISYAREHEGRLVPAFDDDAAAR